MPASPTLHAPAVALQGSPRPAAHARHKPHARGRFDATRKQAYQCVIAGRWDEAARHFAALHGDARLDAADWVAIAATQYRCGRIEATQSAAATALALEPHNAKAAHMLSLSLVVRNRWAEALPIFERFASGPARAHYDFVVNHGVTLQQLQRPQDAVPVLLEAMVMEMADPAIHMRLGLALKELKLYSEAAESFLTACTLDPQRFAARLMVLHMRQYACQWHNFDAASADIVEALARLGEDEASRRGEGAVWALAAIEHPPLLFKKATEQVCAKHERVAAESPLAEPARWVRAAGERLRLGYVSGDFHNHATALLMVEMLEARDRDRFEVTLYSHSPDDGSAMEHRIRSACDRYVDMRAMSERQMAEAIRADGIDILVDLKGHTQGNRLGLFAWRPAPVQAAWLGFPGTCGGAFIDYIVGDRHVTPLAHAERYTERIAQMPHSYQCNDGQRQRPTPSTRADWGLPEDAVVMGCFNQAFKLSPPTFSAWMRILHAVPKALLWLLYDNPQATENLQREAQARGIDPARLVFAPRVPVTPHLARLPVADFMLDNWPCNAHTTASDALWMGVPLVTLSGEIFASRVASGLLHAVGLGELACTSTEQYERVAIELATDAPRLAAMRRTLTEGRTSFPLFDGRRFARDIEALYMRMAERAQAGLPPEHLAAA